MVLHAQHTIRKRVLVTGAPGSSARIFASGFLADGHDVLAVDNYSTRRPDNIAHFLGNPHFEAMHHDATFPLFVEVDEIFNLACPASPVHYQFDPCRRPRPA